MATVILSQCDRADLMHRMLQMDIRTQYAILRLSVASLLVVRRYACVKSLATLDLKL